MWTSSTTTVATTSPVSPRRPRSAPRTWVRWGRHAVPASSSRGARSAPSTSAQDRTRACPTTATPASCRPARRSMPCAAGHRNAGSRPNETDRSTSTWPRTRTPTTDHAGGSLVGGPDPCRVVPQRHRAVAMSESTRDGAQVHTRGEQFGRGVVPELLEHRVDAQLGHQPAVAACERRRVTRLAHVRLRGEHPRAVAQGDAQQRKARSTILAVLPQQGHRRRVDRHPPHLVRLGVLE